MRWRGYAEGSSPGTYAFAGGRAAILVRALIGRHDAGLAFSSALAESTARALAGRFAGASAAMDATQEEIARMVRRICEAAELPDSQGGVIFSLLVGTD